MNNLKKFRKVYVNPALGYNKDPEKIELIEMLPVHPRVFIGIDWAMPGTERTVRRYPDGIVKDYPI